MTDLRDMAEAVAAQHRADNWPPRLNAAAFYAAYRQWMKVNALMDRYGIVLPDDPRRGPRQPLLKRLMHRLFGRGRRKGATLPAQGAASAEDGARLIDLRSVGWIKWDGRAWVRAEAFPPPVSTAPSPAAKSGQER